MVLDFGMFVNIVVSNDIVVVIVDVGFDNVSILDVVVIMLL